jgi:hypothetical protein
MKYEHLTEQNELSCSWEEFKKMGKEFMDAAPTLNIDELDNAWKCFSLGYLNMNETMWRSSACVLFNMAGKVFVKREHELVPEDERSVYHDA